MPEVPRRPNNALLLVPVLFVIITFLFWYQTWFGRPLSDREMGRYLTDTSVPHKTQHALTQMAERMARGDVSAQRWYPKVLALARSPEPQFRLTAAWVMGQDNRSVEFHQALLELLRDRDVRVQWDAALALVRFGDSAGEPQLQLMLQPYTLHAPRTGTAVFKLKKGDALKSGSVVVQVRTSSAETIEVHSPLTGEVQDQVVQDGAQVAQDEPLAILSPGEQQVWEALRGLYFVGGAADLEAIEPYAGRAPGMSDRIRQQAAATAQAIRSRTGN